MEGIWLVHILYLVFVTSQMSASYAHWMALVKLVLVIASQGVVTSEQWSGCYLPSSLCNFIQPGPLPALLEPNSSCSFICLWECWGEGHCTQDNQWIQVCVCCVCCQEWKLCICDVCFCCFSMCASVAAHYELHQVFDKLVITLCKFTTLLNPPEVYNTTICMPSGG